MSSINSDTDCGFVPATPLSAHTAFSSSANSATGGVGLLNGEFDEELQSPCQQENKALLKSSEACSVDQHCVQCIGKAFHNAFRFFLDSWVLLILTAAIGVANNVTCIKILSAHVSVFQITAVRSFFCSVFLIGTCHWKGISLIQPRKKVLLYLLRGITGGTAFLCLALGTFELPLSDSAFISNSYPVVTAVMSWLLGMEHLGLLSWSGVCGCFIGNALVAHPPFLFGGHEDWGGQRVFGIFVALSGNLFMGSSFILIRHLGKGVHSIVLTTYMHIFSFLMSLPFLFVGFPMPVNARHSLAELLCYGATCILGLTIQLASTRALQIGPPTKVSSLFMTNMLLAGFMGVVALSEKMPLISVVGAALIVVSVLLVTMQKPKKIEPYQLVSTVEQIEECELADQVVGKS